MLSALIWIARVAASVVKWSVANPLKALATAVGLKVAGDYLKKQPWAGATLLSSMLYGSAKLYAWPAIGRIGVQATGEAGKAVVDYIIRLLGGGRGGRVWSPWAATGAPFDVGRPR